MRESSGVPIDVPAVLGAPVPSADRQRVNAGATASPCWIGG